jgi:hypothetical protein
MSAWGEYQSVIQLSVALNTAYAALATYLGGDLRLEQQAIKEADSAVPNEEREAKRAVLIELYLLDGELTQATQRYEAVIDWGIRPVCLVASCVGIVLLIVSSICYGSKIDVAWQLLCGIMLLPFIVGVGFAIKLIIKVHRKFATKRKELESRLMKDA